MTTRRMVLFGSAAFATVAAGSAAHQAWLWRTMPPPAAGLRAAIPVFDLRASDPARHAADHVEAVRGLADACLGPLTPVAAASVSLADGIARRWLAQTGSPYMGELERIAGATRLSGVHLLNTSYEWGCTALAAPSPEGDTARLLRTLDWPFHGLGRRVELWRQAGSAGEFVNLSWPGAVGVLTALAPGRFAAAINQPPVKRYVPGDSAVLDAVVAAGVAWSSTGRVPALHLLRMVFERARDFREAQAMLERTPIAAPAIFTLVGVKPDETCVIEREVDVFATRFGVVSAANVWRYSEFPGSWHGGRASEDALDSGTRSRMIETWAGRKGLSFGWAVPPILNSMTRLAVEMDPGRGTLRALGFEESPGEDDTAEPATLPLDWSAAQA